MNPWIGGLLGWWVGGPLGAAAGVALSALWNRAQKNAQEEQLRRDRETWERERREGGTRSGGARTNDAAGTFAVVMMTLVAAVMKADGRATQSELRYVKQFLRAQFSEDFAKDALHALKELLKLNVAVDGTCRRIAAELNYSQRLELLHLLYGVAWADGVFDPGEERLLRNIAGWMAVRAGDAASIAAMFRRQNAEAKAREDAEDDYRILGIERGATDDEVRKAYRRMAMKCHPDKVAHLGPEFQRDAEAKFKRVNEAYERIKKSRGM